MKTMIKEAAILFLITLVSGCLLGAVYSVTKTPIAEAKQRAKEAACKEVFADADSFALKEDLDLAAGNTYLSEQGYKVEINEVSEAVSADGSVLGYVITLTDSEGYGGDIQFSMGVRNDGTINAISFLSISETAGLGMKADPVLTEQLKEKKAESIVYTKTGATAENEIDAISGATITTNAVTNGVNAGLVYFRDVLGGGQDE